MVRSMMLSCKVCGSPFIDDYLYSGFFRNNFEKLIFSQGFHSEFSHRGFLSHSIDLVAAKGQVIFAVREGVVVSICQYFGSGGSHPKYRNKSNYIVIRHEDGTFGRYFHIAKKSAKVQLGSRVLKGDEIAVVGNSGYTTGPHLHFDVTTSYKTCIVQLTLLLDNDVLLVSPCVVSNSSGIVSQNLELKVTDQLNSYCPQDYAMLRVRGKSKIEDMERVASENNFAALIILDMKRSSDFNLDEIGSNLPLKMSTEENILQYAQERSRMLQERCVTIPVVMVPRKTTRALKKNLGKKLFRVRIGLHPKNRDPTRYPYDLSMTVPFQFNV